MGDWLLCYLYIFESVRAALISDTLARMLHFTIWVTCLTGEEERNDSSPHAASVRPSTWRGRAPVGHVLRKPPKAS